MNAVEPRTVSPAITVCNGLATVLTTNIAEVFEKNHRHVLRDVEEIIQRTPEDRRGNFIPVELERPSNLGKGIVKYKAYALTKAGFTFLAMGALPVRKLTSSSGLISMSSTAWKRRSQVRAVQTTSTRPNSARFRRQ